MFDPDIIAKCPVTDSVETILKGFNRTVAYNLPYEFVIKQAQQRLAGRSHAELVAGAKHLKELLVRAEEVEQNNLLQKFSEGQEIIFLSDPLKFSGLFREFELDEKPDFPSATPADYFAVLSLVYVMESLTALKTCDLLRAESPARDSMDGLRIARLPVYAGELLDDAKEIIAFIAGIEFEAIFRQKTARKGNYAKNRPYQVLRSKICEFAFDECSHLSARRASQVAYVQFREEVSETLNTDDPEHRLAKWISQHRKASNK